MVLEEYKIYNKAGKPIGLKEITKFFLYHYPEDVFINEPEPIIKIREGFKELKNLMNLSLPAVKNINQSDWDFIWVVLNEVISEETILKSNYASRLESIRETYKG